MVTATQQRQQRFTAGNQNIVNSAAAVHELTDRLRTIGMNPGDIDPIGFLNRCAGSVASLGHLAVSDKSDLPQCIGDLRSYQSLISDPMDGANLDRLINVLSIISADPTPAPGDIFSITKALHEHVPNLAGKRQDVLDIYDPAQNSFNVNPLGYISAYIPPNGDVSAITPATVQVSLASRHQEQRDLLALASQLYPISTGNVWLDHFADNCIQEIQATQRLLQQYEAAVIADLPNQRADLKNARDAALAHSVDDLADKTAFGPFIDAGLSVVQGQIPDEGVDQNGNSLVTRPAPDRRDPNRLSHANNDQVPDDVIIPHKTYAEFTQELQTLQTQLETARVTGDATLQAKIKKQLENIEILQIAVQDEDTYEISVQEGARFALKRRREFDAVLGGQNAVEPDWDDLARRFPGRRPKKGEDPVFDKFQEEYNSQYPYFQVLSGNHVAGMKDVEIREGYEARMRELRNPQVRIAFGQQRCDMYEQLVQNAYDTLIDPASKLTYLRECDARKDRYLKYILNIRMHEAEKPEKDMRQIARETIMQQKNASWIDKVLNRIDWAAVATNPVSQFVVNLAGYASIAATPQVLLGVGAAAFFLVGPGVPVVTFALIGGALSAFLDQKFEVSLERTIDNGIESIYKRARSYFDIAYTTGLKADIRGYLPLEQRTDRLEQILGQYLRDFEEQFGKDNVQEILFELVRTRAQTRFHEGVFQSSDKDAFNRDIEQTQNRKTLSSFRMQLVLGERFPPKSFFDNHQDPSVRQLSTMIPQNRFMEEGDPMWQAIIDKDPDFQNKFTTRAQIERRLDQPTDIFSVGEDFKQVTIGLGLFGRKALSRANLESNELESHRLKRDVLNLFQVIELGHKLSNAIKYELCVVSLNAANKQLDTNIAGSGVIDGKDSDGFAAKVMRKRAASFSELAHGIGERRSKKK